MDDEKKKRDMQHPLKRRGGKLLQNKNDEGQKQKQTIKTNGEKSHAKNE